MSTLGRVMAGLSLWNGVFAYLNWAEHRTLALICAGGVLVAGGIAYAEWVEAR